MYVAVVPAVTFILVSSVKLLLLVLLLCLTLLLLMLSADVTFMSVSDAVTLLLVC